MRLHGTPLADRPVVRAAVLDAIRALRQCPESAPLVDGFFHHPLPVADLPGYLRRCLPDYLRRCLPIPADENPRHALLRVLHPTGYRDLRALTNGGPPVTVSVPADDLASVDRFAERYADRNIFVGVAPRRDANGRDTHACQTLHALFVDQDFKGSSEAEARARLAAFPLRPSATVASGGGLHSYWLLTEPLDLQNGGAALAKETLIALATAVGADLSAAEPARILRLPGTRNHKYTPPRDAVLETFDVSRRYALAEVQAVLRDSAPSPTSTKTTKASQEIPTSIPHGQQHKTLFREGYRLRRLGWEDKEIADALWSLHTHRSEGVADLSEYEQQREREEIDALAADICKRYAPADDPFPLTEAGDAEFFADCYADRVRFDHRQGRWLILDQRSGIWLPDGTDAITTLALEAVRMRQRLALQITDSDKRQKAFAWTGKGESRARLTNLLTLARGLDPIADAGDQWDTIPHLLGTPDEVVDFRSGERRPALPDERITMRTTATYDPEAMSSLWTTTLVAIFPDASQRTWLQTALGYSITGNMNLDTWFLPNGEKGRNGKGTIFGAVASTLGDYAMEIDAATFDKRQPTPYNLAQLPGKRFVHCSEAGNTTTLHHERLKQVTGGDKVRAADKYQRAFQFEPRCKLWFTCNERPKVTDESAAFWARVVVVLFQQTFLGKEDTSIRDALRHEDEHQRAVLRWLVDGARRFYQQKGLGTLPTAFANATKEFQRENERIAEFLAQCCDESNKDAKTKASHLWSTYQTWAKETGVKYPLGSKKFYQAMAKRFEKKPEDDGAWYLGVTVPEQPKPELSLP